MSAKTALKKRPHKKFNTGWFFVIPAIISFCLFAYYPTLLGFIISFFDYKAKNPFGKFVGLSNYIRAFSDANMWNALGNNVGFWFVMLTINFLIPLILAVMVGEVRKRQTLVRTLYYIPAILPSVVTAILWKYFWQPDYGLANSIMNFLGLKTQLWLNDTELVKWCMRFPYLFIFAGLNAGMDFIINLAAINEVPQELYESAQIDGASFWDRLTRITLPSIKGTLGMLLVMNTIYVFNLFDEIKIITDGGPVRSTETIIFYAYQSAYKSLDYSYATTITTISFLIILILTLVQFKLQRQNQYKGGK